MKSLMIVPYNPHWPAIFKEEADRLQKALEDNVVLIFIMWDRRQFQTYGQSQLLI